MARLCFVIMPFGRGKQAEASRNRFEYMIRPAVEGLRVNGRRVLRCVRADLDAPTGFITANVVRRLLEAAVVIADITDHEPGVMWELGVRHAMRRGTVLIAERGVRVRTPFSLVDLVVVYYVDRVGSERSVIPQLRRALAEILKASPCDSPVLSAMAASSAGRSRTRRRGASAST